MIPSACCVTSAHDILQEDMTNDIGHGIALIVPVMTLDTLVGTLVIGVGTLTGVHKLGFMCLFGCLSVVANYLAFMTLYPACLSIGVQVIYIHV